VFDQHDVAPVLLAEKFGEAWPMGGLQRVALALERASFRSADLVVFANVEYERRARDLRLLGCPGAIVPHGWRLPDARPTAPARDNRPVIAYVGMLNEQDCVLHLVEALALLPGIEGLRVVIAGDGSELPRAQQLAEELGIAGSIEWLGWVADRARLGELVRSARACVAPEYDSPFNRLASFVKIVEYMSAGAAIAAHRLPQTEALCGETVEYARDMTPAALADALATLLRDDTRSAELGAAARARFDERIWWGNVGRRRLIDAYADTFGHPSAARAGEGTIPTRNANAFSEK
jgi:glycosyltransferase involved in cell wall biosynthesis